MKTNEILTAFWKIPLLAVLYVASIAIGSGIALKAGFAMPSLPKGADMSAIQRAMPCISLLMVFSLLPISRRIRGGYAMRWLLLALFAWISFGAITAIEASLFTTGFAPGRSAFLLMHFVSLAMTAAGVAWLYPPANASDHASFDLAAALKAFASQEGILRLVVAALIYVPVYYFFGFLLATLAPGVVDFYRHASFELRLPSQSEILPVQIVKSLLLFLTCMPIFLAWKPGDKRLWLSLGWGLFVLTGLVGMIQANWYPVGMRAAHGIELFADAMTYAFLLTVVLSKPLTRKADAPLNWNVIV